ncbi:hypothetical protein CROQUDRAFT_99710 [Cronartium quercuum f. sp. fusiforme G11]|uniref:Uncharacterized protein n=1 Tax=Cronartium quercuum f. sp. fusiforme G11 TaxID=708437 RepID=A0A9P6T6M9_9BASI|nr:hypothetical protein CROQUDRAFT_99710 [Cronartium quercuum f. sp. fusiforme G11]
MTTSEEKDVIRATFTKLNSPHADSNWMFWDYRIMTTPAVEVINDEASASSYISERIDDDNVALVIGYRGKPRLMYETLRTVHQNKTAGGGLPQYPKTDDAICRQCGRHSESLVQYGIALPKALLTVHR